MLMRVHACVTAAAGVFTVPLLLGEFHWSSTMFLAASIVFLITGAGNGLNDYYDYAIDKINRRRRPIPSGAVSRTGAFFFSHTLFFAGVALSLFLPWGCTVLAVLNTALLILYAMDSKRWGVAKNFVVGYMVASIFIFGSLALRGANLLVLVLAACAFLATLSREIVKDIEDLAGDRDGQARTLPILFGEPTASRVAFGALLAAVLLALVPYAVGHLDYRFVIMVLAGGGFFVYAYLLDNPPKSQRFIMAGTLVEMSAFVFAKIW
jgi:geranylgeranylglycerol-phosphate geranylgeranyltransferase